MDNDIEVISYQSFIDIAVHIKKDKMKPKAIKTSSFFEDKKKDRKLPKKTAQQQDYYVGSWYVSVMMAYGVRYIIGMTDYF